MTPSARIADEIRRRIAAGELRPGERVPSARQITQEWGVAIATATKVLAVLRDEGLVRAVPGVGTVVAGVTKERGTRRRDDGELTRDRIARAAVQIADAEGIASLSMRRVAADLDLPTMSLYRYVRSKEELILLMVDVVFDEHRLPEPPPPGWRAQLELVARLQWNVCRAHPWLGRAISFTRPQLAPRAMAHTEWAMRAVDQLGLNPGMMMYVVLTVTAFVIGTAVNLEFETEAQQDSGISSTEWMQNQDAQFQQILASGQFPHIGRLAEVPDFDVELDVLFDFGLQRMLDGLEVYMGR